MAGIAEALIALLGGGLSGYNQGRQQLFANRRADKEDARADRQITNQETQFGQTIGLQGELGRGGLDLNRERLGLERELGLGGLNLSRDRFGLDKEVFGESKRQNDVSAIFQVPNFARNMRGVNPALAVGASNALAANVPGLPTYQPGEGSPYPKDPNEEGLRLENMIRAGNAGLGMEQLGVGRPDADQVGIGMMRDSILKQGGLPAMAQPFDRREVSDRVMPSFEDAFGAIFSGNAPPEGRTETRTEVGPGFSPSAATAQTTAQTRLIDSNRKQQEEETRLLPARLQNEAAKIRADIEKFGMEYALRVHQINADQARAIMSDATARRGQDFGLTGRMFEARGAKEAKLQGQIEKADSEAEKAEQEAADLQASVEAIEATASTGPFGLGGTSYKDPVTGKKLSKAALVQYQKMLQNKRKAAESARKRAESLRGQLTPATLGLGGGGRTIQRSGGGALIVTPVN